MEVSAGSAVYIRGQGDGLSWDKGQPLRRGFGGTWIWTTNKATGMVRFRLLLNDRIHAIGGAVSLKAGQLLELAPAFACPEPRCGVQPRRGEQAL